MKNLKLTKFLLLAVIALLLAGCGNFSQSPAPTPTPIPLSADEIADTFEYKWREIAFDDLIPSGLDVDLQQCWNGMGMDDKGRIYIGFTSFRDNSKYEDFVVFRYDPATEKREFLGTFMDIAAANNNLGKARASPRGTHA